MPNLGEKFLYVTFLGDSGWYFWGNSKGVDVGVVFWVCGGIFGWKRWRESFFTCSGNEYLWGGEFVSGTIGVNLGVDTRFRLYCRIFLTELCWGRERKATFPADFCKVDSLFPGIDFFILRAYMVGVHCKLVVDQSSPGSGVSFGRYNGGVILVHIVGINIMKGEVAEVGSGVGKSDISMCVAICGRGCDQDNSR